MTKKISSRLDSFIKSASQTGLSAKASSVYVILLEEGIALSPKNIIIKTSLHRQYVYNAIHELGLLGLISPVGKGKSVKYIATSPDKLLLEVEKKRIDTIDSVGNLMKLYNKSPAGVVEVISGSLACIESEFKILEESKDGDYLDIIGGAGMHFVELFKDRIEEWEALRAKKNIKLRYIGSGDDVEHNKNKSIIKNDSRSIKGIENIVNVSIRPESVSFNIYVPEIMTIRVRSDSAVKSQRALFETLWNIAK
jgi:sugar-specific transcriptional regulator TrmB